MAILIMNKGTSSVFGGAMIIAGTIIGAGMFSLPVVMAGAWIYWSLLILIFTWYCMYVSGLMLLEANLNYQAGASFDTITKDLLGRAWNIFNGFTVAFVLYILTYAYISASGSVIHHTLVNFSINLPERLGGCLFAIGVGFIVWLSTSAVSRMASFFLTAKIITFFMTFGGLFWNIKPVTLLNSEEINPSYFPYIFMTLPFCLASFGYHGNIPSLMKFYGKEPQKIKHCLFIGTFLALTLYSIWMIGSMGNIPRTEFIEMGKRGGNIEVLVESLGNVLNNRYLDFLLIIFSNFAVACSFLGVTLGLFDYIADLFKFEDTKLGRFKTALVTFLPPIVGGLIYPDGFIHAIGFAGLAATVWAVIVPALLARASRKKFGSPLFRARGGNGMIILILLFGITTALIHILSNFNLLPIYK